MHPGLLAEYAEVLLRMAGVNYTISAAYSPTLGPDTDWGTYHEESGEIAPAVELL